MSDSPIVIVEKVQLRRGLQVELPGKPISTSPLRLAPGLDLAEMGFAEDTGRLFIGHSPRVNDVNYKRGVFPYQNLEVLTENSPRVEELFNSFVRDQDVNDHFLPTVLPVGFNGPLAYAELPAGTTIPSQFFGDSVSVVVEYHAFKEATGWPVKQGTLRIIASTSGSNIIEDSVSDSVQLGGGLNFSLSGRSASSQGNYFTLTCNNLTGGAVTLHLRRVVIAGLAADLDDDTPQ